MLNKFGLIAATAWKDIPQHYPNVRMDIFQIMPNHIHGIIEIFDNRVGTESYSVPTRPPLVFTRPSRYGLLSKIVKSFKHTVTKTIRDKFRNYEFGWQRSFYDHIINNEKEYTRIANYIADNPMNWKNDHNHL